VQHDLVRPHAAVEPLRRLRKGRFEQGVLERLDLAAAVADEVVVVIAVCVGRLEAGDAVPELDPLHEPELDELVECAVHARDADAAALVANAVEDLLRGAAAGLGAEMLDNRPAGAAVPTALGLEAREGVGAPVSVICVHPK